MHGRKKVSTLLFNVSNCYTNTNYVDILTDIKVQSTNFASASFFLIDKFLTREVTINFFLYIISYHYNFIQVFGTNLIIHNTHLIGTTTELNFASAC